MHAMARAVSHDARESEPPPERLVTSAPARAPSLGRRALLGAAGALGVGSLLEWASFRGRFDHRKPAGASAERSYLDSLDRLEGHDAVRSAFVHVGHSTHLLSMAGVRLLTDPWFNDPAFGALAHERPPAALPRDIGRLDVVLITHDHADHADMRAMDQMDKRALVLVSTADLQARVRKLGFREVSVLAPWEDRAVRGVSITAVPGLHDIYEIGYVIRGGDRTVYFAGDTRLHDDLPAIAERFAPDVAILPVDGTRLAGGALHVMTPEDAVTAARTLKSKIVIPSHAEAVFSDPLVEVALASTVARARYLFGEAMGRALPGVRCVVPDPGDLVDL